MAGKPLNDSLKNIFKVIFQKMIVHSNAYNDNEISVDNVFQPAFKHNRPLFVELCSELLLAESGVDGFENLVKLSRLSEKGESCLICAKHCSNFDVPNFYTLLSRYGQEALDIFDRIIFIAGRKLNEDVPETKMLTEMFNRVVLSPQSYLDSLGPDGDEKRKEAKHINIAAQRKIRELRKQGYILLLYPTGTRTRSDVPKTSRALKQAESYLRMFDNVCFMNVLGNTLPPMLSGDMVSEIPHTDVVKFIVGPVQKVGDWLRVANNSFEKCDDATIERKQWIADLIMDEINKLG